MYKKSAIFFLALGISAQCAFGDVTAQAIENAIDIGRLEHPYLYFTKDDIATLRERVQNDPEAKDIWARQKAEANRLMYTPVDRELKIEPRNPRFVERNEQISHFGTCMRSAQTLAFIYQMTGEEKYARKAFEFADVICDYQLWCYRAHEFPIIYSRVWPWGVADDQVTFSYDIRTGHTGYEMALVYDWLYPALTKRQRDRIRGALLEKCILLARRNYDYHWWANSYRCNWLGICFTGMGTASIALLTEDPQLVDVIAESYNRMHRMFDEIGVDGGWQEGRSYWAYGFRSCMPFMESLNRATNGTYSLYKHRSWQDNPADFALYGMTGYFGDGSGGVVGSTYMLNKLVDESGDTTAAWYRNNYFGAGSSIFDIIWPRSDVKGVKPTVASKHFRTIDWVVMRAGFKQPENVVIATKAGWNNDPHHGHLDCGSIMLNWQGQAFLMDLGSGRYFYDEKYFDEARWSYPQASSTGHNLILVNGEQQLSAKYKDKPWTEGIGGKVLEFRTGKKRDYTLMDPSGAYPKKELKNWRRHIVLEKPDIAVVLDEVKAVRGAEIEARFHSECDAEFKDGYVLLNGKKGVMALIPVVDGDFTIRQGKHPYLPVRQNASFQWINYFGTVLNAQDENTEIGTVIVPVVNEKEAEKIVSSAKLVKDRSGNVTVSFKKSGKTYRYTYEKTEDGFVLAK